MKESRELSNNLLENEGDLNSFLKLERRTSLVYKELLSKRIIESSAYKLPDSLKKIFNQTVSIFNINENNSTPSNENADYRKKDKTPSPLKKKQLIIDVLSKCKMNFTQKLNLEKKKRANSMIHEEKLENSFLNENKQINISIDSLKNEEIRIKVMRSNLNSISDFNFDKCKNYTNQNRSHLEFSPESINNNNSLNKINYANLKGSESVIGKFHKDNKAEKGIKEYNINSKNFNTCIYLDRGGVKENNSNSYLDCNSSNRFIDNYSSNNKSKSIIESVFTNESNFIDEKFCRICKEDTETVDNILISPCNCDGLFQYMHSQCIVSILKDFKIFNNEKRVCEICNTPYQYTFKKYKKLRIREKSNSKRSSKFIVILIPLLIIFSIFLLKDLLENKYNFIEFLIIVISGILVISVVFYFRDILRFHYTDEWVLFNCKRERKSHLGELSFFNLKMRNEEKNVNNFINEEYQNLIIKAKSLSPKKKFSKFYKLNEMIKSPLKGLIKKSNFNSEKIKKSKFFNQIQTNKRNDINKNLNEDDTDFKLHISQCGLENDFDDEYVKPISVFSEYNCDDEYITQNNNRVIFTIKPSLKVLGSSTNDLENNKNIGTMPNKTSKFNIEFPSILSSLNNNETSIQNINRKLEAPERRFSVMYNDKKQTKKLDIKSKIYKYTTKT